MVAAVLLYDSETWVLPPSVLRALEGFHVVWQCYPRLTAVEEDGGHHGLVEYTRDGKV